MVDKLCRACLLGQSKDILLNADNDSPQAGDCRASNAFLQVFCASAPVGAYANILVVIISAAKAHCIEFSWKIRYFCHLTMLATSLGCK